MEVVHPTKSKQNLRVKLVNLQDCVWENHYASSYEQIPAAEAAVDKEWEKLEKISAWNLTKVKSKRQR